MLYISKINDYFKIFTDEEVKDFAAINLSEYFTSIREGEYLKVAKLLYNFVTKPDEEEKYAQSNSSDQCINQHNVKI